MPQGVNDDNLQRRRCHSSDPLLPDELAPDLWNRSSCSVRKVLDQPPQMALAETMK